MFKRKDVLFIFLLTFITVAAWIGFNIYHIVVTSTISEEIQEQITPINPNFDTATVNKLKSREQIEPLYLFNESNTGKRASNTAELTITPTVNYATDSAAVELIPSVTTAP